MFLFFGFHLESDDKPSGQRGSSNRLRNTGYHEKIVLLLQYHNLSHNYCQPLTEKKPSIYDVWIGHFNSYTFLIHKTEDLQFKNNTILWDISIIFYDQA